MTEMICGSASLKLGVVAAAAVLALSAPAFARAGGDGGFGVHFGGGGFGGVSGAHISTQGVANTNGSSSRDRDFGLDRAHDRMNKHGLDHSHGK